MDVVKEELVPVLQEVIELLIRLVDRNNYFIFCEVIASKSLTPLTTSSTASLLSESLSSTRVVQVGVTNWF